jgi:hypothetical protein
MPYRLCGIFIRRQSFETLTNEITGFSTIV